MVTSNQQILDQIAQARARTEVREAKEPKAINACYNSSSKMVEVYFNNGAMFAFPYALGQGLDGATEKLLSQVRVTPSGYGLEWEDLDVHLDIPALMSGIYGTKNWMKELAKRGGSATSTAKTSASRENGKKGGRPRRKAATERFIIEDKRNPKIRKAHAERIERIVKSMGIDIEIEDSSLQIDKTEK